MIGRQICVTVFGLRGCLTEAAAPTSDTQRPLFLIPYSRKITADVRLCVHCGTETVNPDKGTQTQKTTPILILSHAVHPSYPSFATYSNGRSFCSSPGAILAPPNLRGLTLPADLSSSVFRAFFSFSISLSCDLCICTRHAEGK